MMFSVEKCTGRNGTGASEESELYAGGGEAMGKEGVPSDEVASAVAAVSDEIGDILKDELGDADRADRIGAELADLSAELGFLAGLADGESQPDFASRFEVHASLPFEWLAVSTIGTYNCRKILFHSCCCCIMKSRLFCSLKFLILLIRARF